MFSRLPNPGLLVLCLGLLLAGSLAGSAAQPGAVERVSLSPLAAEGDADSTGPVSVSADGRFVAFASDAGNFAAFDQNGVADIYVRDLRTRFTELISLGNPPGGPLPPPDAQRQLADGPSSFPSISADGRFVAFESDATNLVLADTNALRDVFVRDRLGNAVRVSVGPAGAQATGASGAPSISASGAIVAYHSVAPNLVVGDTNMQQDVFVSTISPPPFGFGLPVVSTQRASTAFGGAQSDGASANPAISASGRFVAFESDATNLVTGDTNGMSDIFVKDVVTGRVDRVSVDDAGIEGDGNSTLPSISADGRFVIFVSEAENLVADDTNGVADVFARDRVTGVTVRVSLDSDGGEGDMASGVVLDPVSALPTILGRPAISSDGRFAVFQSDATNLVLDDTNAFSDVFLRDLALLTTDRISRSTDGIEGDEASVAPAVSADGSVAAFASLASTLVTADTNFASDVFILCVGAGGIGNSRPFADAGMDQDVFEGDLVALDGFGSFDPEGDPLLYLWSQVDDGSGAPRVTLSDPTAPGPTFIAPPVASFETLEFELVVSDGVNISDPSSVLVDVSAAPPGTLLGMVTDASNRAVPGAIIEVVRVDGQAAMPAVADGGGLYVVPDVRVGVNTVRVSKPGFEPKVLTGPDAITVASLETVVRDFVLDANTAKVVGTIILADGSPLVTATVALLDGEGNVLASDSTDSAGEYVLDDLDRFTVNAAASLRIRHPALVDWVIGNLLLTPGGITRRDFRYANLQVTVDTSPRRLRRQLDGTRVELLMGEVVVAENAAGRKVRRLNFPNVPATILRVRAVNPLLTGDLVQVNLQPGPRTNRITVRLEGRDIF